MRARLAVSLVSLLSLGPGVGAQAVDLGRSHSVSGRFMGGIQLLAGESDGEFRSFVKDGIGVGGNLMYRIDRDGVFALRLDADLINYGSERRDFCLAGIGCRIELRLSTDNNIATFGIGPQLMVPRGRIRPYARGSVGVSYFFTQSSLRGTGSSDNELSTTNYDDASFAWSAGGGMYVLLHNGRHPVLLDLAAQYHNNGRVSYLKEGGIIDNPDGSITLNPIRSQANLAVYRLGVEIGF